jgi:glycosyltransferase involved in cell wall biosynthesis
MTKLPISLVVITLNEDRNIERCIKSVPFASDVVVLDSGSQDQTLKKAADLGARVVTESWQGFGPQKRRATELAQHDWVINLDADEALSEELQNEIINRFTQLNPRVGYLFPRRSFHLGRWILNGGWYPDRQLRLYNRQFSNWSEVQIHERVQAPAEESFTHPLLHWVFENLSDQVQTNNRYSGLQAQREREQGKKFSVLKLIFKPCSKFLECYILKQGYRDGLPGLVIAVGAGYSVFLRWAKLWELEMLDRKSKES